MASSWSKRQGRWRAESAIAGLGPDARGIVSSRGDDPVLGHDRRHYRTLEDGLAHIGVADRRGLEVGVREIGPAQPRSRQIGPAEIGLEEAGDGMAAGSAAVLILDLGRVEVGVAEIGLR